MKSHLIHRIAIGLAACAVTLLAIFAVMTNLSSTVGDVSVAHASETVVIDVGTNWFCSATFENGVCETTIQTGDTVEWSFIEGFHNSTECGDNWSKGNSCSGAAWASEAVVLPPGTFSYTFDTPGAIYYRCTIHPDSMKGIITVESLATPSPAPTAEPTPTATAAPTLTPTPSPTTPPPSTTLAPTSAPAPTPTATPTPTVDPTPTAEPPTPTPTPTDPATPTPSPIVSATPTPASTPTASASPGPSPSSTPSEPDPATASPSALGAKGLPAGGGWPGVSGGFDVVGLLIAINLPLAALSFAAFRWCMRRWSAT